MKKYNVVATGFVILSGLVALPAVQAQDKGAGDSADTREVSTHALQFQVDKLLDLSSFQGGLLSYKYHFDNTNAIRMGIDLDGYDTEEDGEIHAVARDTNRREPVGAIALIDSLHRETNGDRNSLNILIRSQYVKYFPVSEEIKVYGGIGPSLAYRKNNRVSTANFDRESAITFVDTTLNGQFEIVSGESERNSEITTVGIGVTTVLGVEWFATENIGLTIEYGFSVGYEHSETENGEKRTVLMREIDDNEERKEVTNQQATQERNTWNFSDNPVKLGLTVYF